MIRFAKISTGLTVFAATGFLIGAILTDNGSGIKNQRPDEAKVVLVEPVSSDNGTDKIDSVITSSIQPVKNINVEPLSEIQKTRERRLELLRQNANAQPTVPIKPVKQALKTESNSTYTVQPGDTLFGIGRKNGLSVPQIAELNGLSDPYRIRPGQKLIISQ